MSATTARLPLAEGRLLAEELAKLLRPACVRLEVCGSIRRGTPTVGDVDLLCEPITEPVADMFGTPTGEVVDLLDARCDELWALGELRQRLDRNGRPAWGRKLKRALYRGIAVDIRACYDATTWGAWLVISTGPSEFNKALVTPRAQGGRLPPGFEWKRDAGFQLHRYGGRVETPTEQAVFEALGIPYIAPGDRR